jgi:hypothetical protein
MQYVSLSNRKGGGANPRPAGNGARKLPVGWSEEDSQSPAQQGRAALMQAKLGPRVDLNGKIQEAIIRQAVFLIGLAGLGIYAHDFVVEGIMAKAALNLTIVGVFLLASGISISIVLQMRNEKKALDALRIDFGDPRPTLDVVDRPATVFKKPKLLGYGYRLVTEELLARNKGQLPTETIHILVGDVDHRIKDAQATMGYFGGLLVFLGLLGAFMGLMTTVSSVGELIGSLGGDGGGGFNAMIEGMKKPLHGMSVGFSSSLFGLMFSMVVGVLDRFMVSAMKAVRNEFEACLIDLAHLEMADHEADHAPAAAHWPAHAPTYAPNALSVTEDSAALLEQLKRNEQQSQETNRLLSDMNATMFALATSLRQSAEADSRTALGEVLTGLARSQRDLAAQLSTMNQESSDQNLRIVNAIEAASRSAEETRTVMQDLAFRISQGPEIPMGAVGTGLHHPAAQAAQAGDAAPVMIGRMRREPPPVGAPAATPALTPAQKQQAIMAPPFPMPAQAMPEDPNETGARALMAKLSQAMGQRKGSGAPTLGKGVSEEKGKQLERAMLATQQLSRQVLRRMDEQRRDETRSAVAISKAQRQVIASMDMLVKRIDELMDSGEIVAKGGVERLNSTLDQTKALLDVKIDRLEQHLSANQRIAERTEKVAAETAKALQSAPPVRATAVGE